MAMVIDVYSRKAVAWDFGERTTADLVILALNLARMTRKSQSVIHNPWAVNTPALRQRVL